MYRRGKPYEDKKTGRWVAVWYLGAKRQRSRTEYKKESDVEENFDKIVREYYGVGGAGGAEGGQIGPPVDFLGEAVNDFINEKESAVTAGKLSHHTAGQYSSVLNNFVAITGEDMPLALLDYRLVQAFLDAHRAFRIEKGGKISNATLATELRVIKTFAGYCKSKGWLGNRFTDGVKPITVSRHRMRLLKPGQIKKFLAACPLEFRQIALFVILTGLRRKELVHVRWGDINWDESELHVYRFKTDTEQDIPLHPVVVKMLGSMEHISEWVFPVTRTTFGPKKSHVRKGDQRSETTQWFNYQTKKAAKAIGLRSDAVDFHGLRKTCANLLYTAGADERTAGDFIGHSPASKGGVTDLYVFSSQKRQREAIEAVELDLEGLEYCHTSATNLPQEAVSS